MRDYREMIVSSPGVMMGKPVIAGTRITVELILEKLAAGETIEQVLAAHPRLYPQNLNLDGTLRLVGSHKVLESIRRGESPSRIWYDWQEGLERFKKVRAQYLLYP